jgi:RecB family exonuclease
MRNSEEPFLFFLALSMPAQAVVLSSAREDEAGGALAPSPFLVEVSRRLGVNSQIEDRLSPEVGVGEEPLSERELLNSAARAGLLERIAADAGIADGRVVSIVRRVRVEHHRAEFFARPTRETLFERRLRAARKSKTWTTADARAPDRDKSLLAGEFDGCVSTNERLERILVRAGPDQPRVWSAKQLTEMAVCGFNFFARRILRLHDPDELEHEPTRTETGDLVHRILSDFFKDQPDLSVPASALSRAMETAERFRAREAAAARDAAFFELRWSAVREMVEEAVLYESARRAAGAAPDELEPEYPLAFTLEPNEPESQAIAIAGWIDRLELYLDAEERIARMRVVDYKSSRNLKALAERLKPPKFAVSDLQMPVYLLGASTQLARRLAPKAMFEASYIALQNRAKETAPQAIPHELLESGPDGLVVERIRELIGDARAGRFEADPIECSDWCPYRPICRFEKPAA